MKNFLSIFIASFLLLACQAKSSNQPISEETVSEKADTLIVDKPPVIKTATEAYLDSLGMVEIQSYDPSIPCNLMYSTTNNFTGKILYSDLQKAYLHPVAAEKLKKAQQLLKNYDPSLSLIVCDAVRPLSVQKEMYAVVQNTKYHKYVAHPSRTSLHNYGMAVDLTIRLSDGHDMDMGTPVDFFGKEAGINQEESLKAQGLLTREQIDNRKLLRRIMTEAGFQPIRGEWWHFNACSLDEAKRNYKLIE